MCVYQCVMMWVDCKYGASSPPPIKYSSFDSDKNDFFSICSSLKYQFKVKMVTLDDDVDISLCDDVSWLQIWRLLHNENINTQHQHQ